MALVSIYTRKNLRLLWVSYCNDMTMVDITNIPGVEEGDEVRFSVIK
jgi:alanine racemase